MSTLKRLIVIPVMFLTATFLFATLAGAATVGTASKQGIGTYLVDDKGMTLYVFSKDSTGTSVCSGMCLDIWPPYAENEITAGGTLQAKDFGTITRDNGIKQVTYKGMPLYLFSKDEKPGDTNGQGVHNVWHAATP